MNSLQQYSRDKMIIKGYTEDNATMQELGNAFGITRQRVQQILVKNHVKAVRGPKGYPLGQRHRRTLEIIPRILEKHDNGWTQVRIAETFLCSTHTVMTILKENGRQSRRSEKTRIRNGVKEHLCARCKQWKPVDRFVITNRGHGYCIICNREHTRQYNHEKALRLPTGIDPRD